jgi:hypothetical protein
LDDSLKVCSDRISYFITGILTRFIIIASYFIFLDIIIGMPQRQESQEGTRRRALWIQLL